MKTVCSVYRCAKKAGMYIYIDKANGLNVLPEELKKCAGKMTLAMTLVITPNKKLAKAKAENVLAAIDNQGFYVQMPPSLSDEMQAVSQANSFLER